VHPRDFATVPRDLPLFLLAEGAPLFVGCEVTFSRREADQNATKCPLIAHIAVITVEKDESMVTRFIDMQI
jgi:hypothetical protein